VINYINDFVILIIICQYCDLHLPVIILIDYISFIFIYFNYQLYGNIEDIHIIKLILYFLFTSSLSYLQSQQILLHEL